MAKKQKTQTTFFDHLKNNLENIDLNQSSTDLNQLKKDLKPSKLCHGGDLNKGKRKEKRPVSTRKYMHLVLKSSYAKGEFSFLNAKHRLQIDRIIKTTAKKNFVVIADGVNMGNHFHLKVKCKDPVYFKRFLRIITCKIVMLVTGARKGKSFGKRFLDSIPYTRILTSSKEELGLRGYFEANRIERENGKAARENYLKEFNQWFYNLTHSTA